MFGKMGIGLSPVLMAKVDKDPQFRSFLWKNHKEVALYGVQALMYAYKHNISVEEARRVCSVKNSIDREVAFMVPEVKGTKIDRGKLLDYVLDLKEGSGSYNDYLKAIKALKLDLKDTKNVFPRDFKAMHDLRIGEYSSLKAKLDKENRDKLYRDFAHRCEALMSLEYTSGDLSVKIPSSIDDLIAEGDALHHCVGRLGYDLKVVEGKSIIAFIRKNSDLSKPYVTAEYSIKEEKIRQCYADHNTQPPSEVITFVGIWADKVSRFMKGAKK
jgi:hypothetical protein